MRTDPALGSGMSRSTISNGPLGRGTWTARIFAMMPPIDDLVIRCGRGRLSRMKLALRAFANVRHTPCGTLELMAANLVPAVVPVADVAQQRGVRECLQ